MNYFRERPLVAGSILILGLMFATNFIVTDAMGHFALVPINTLIAHKYIWNIFTSSFYERHPFKLVLDVTFLVLTANRPILIANVEQFAWYFAAVTAICAFGTSALFFCKFFLTRMEDTLAIPSFGFGGVYITILMFCRQQFKNEPIFSVFPQLTYHNIPIVYMSIQTIFWFCQLHAYTHDIAFTFISLLASWSYLRFFYKFDSNGPINNNNNITPAAMAAHGLSALLTPGGDLSEDFTFVGMFPTAIRPVTVPFTTAFNNLFVLLGIFPDIESDLDKMRSQLNPHHLKYHNPITVEEVVGKETENIAADALQERRRAKAMKLLGAKLAEISQRDGGGVNEWGSPLKPSLLESDSTLMHIESSSNSSSSGSSSINGGGVGMVVTDLNRSAFAHMSDQDYGSRVPDAAFKV